MVPPTSPTDWLRGRCRPRRPRHRQRWRDRRSARSIAFAPRDRPCGQPRPVGPLAAHLPQDHRRSARRCQHHRVPRGWRRLCRRRRAAELRRPHPASVAAGGLLGAGGLLFGGGFVAQAFAGGFPTFALANVASQIGSSPQHPVGNGLLAEQFPPERRGFAISAHITGGTSGRSSWRSSGRRSSPPSAGAARPSSSGCRPWRSRATAQRKLASDVACRSAIWIKTFEINPVTTCHCIHRLPRSQNFLTRLGSTFNFQP